MVAAPKTTTQTNNNNKGSSVVPSSVGNTAVNFGDGLKRIGVTIGNSNKVHDGGSPGHLKLSPNFYFAQNTN